MAKIGRQSEKTSTKRPVKPHWTSLRYSPVMLTSRYRLRAFVWKLNWTTDQQWPVNPRMKFSLTPPVNRASSSHGSKFCPPVLFNWHGITMKCRRRRICTTLKNAVDHRCHGRKSFKSLWDRALRLSVNWRMLSDVNSVWSRQYLVQVCVRQQRLFPLRVVLSEIGSDVEPDVLTVHNVNEWLSSLRLVPTSSNTVDIDISEDGFKEFDRYKVEYTTIDGSDQWIQVGKDTLVGLLAEQEYFDLDAGYCSWQSPSNYRQSSRRRGLQVSFHSRSGRDVEHQRRQCFSIVVGSRCENAVSKKSQMSVQWFHHGWDPLVSLRTF